MAREPERFKGESKLKEFLDQWIRESSMMNLNGLVHIRDIIRRLGPVKSKNNLREGLKALGWKKKYWFFDFYYCPDYKPNYWM